VRGVVSRQTHCAGEFGDWSLNYGNGKVWTVWALVITGLMTKQMMESIVICQIEGTADIKGGWGVTSIGLWCM